MVREGEHGLVGVPIEAPPADWQAGSPQWGAGRFCNIFEIWDFKIQRLHIYLDPDYAGRDTDRYPWLAREVAGVG